MKATNRWATAALLGALAGSCSAQTTTGKPKPATAKTATAASTAPKRHVPLKKAAAPCDLPPLASLPNGLIAVDAPVKVQYAMRYQDEVIGSGAEAAPGKFYRVNYTGWLEEDGTKFDSSFDHPGQEPIVFPQGRRAVIPGWDQGFEGMKVGGKRRLFIPYQLAYGALGRGPIPPKANLIFDVELLDVMETPNAPAAPAAATAPAQPAAPATPSTPAQPK